MNILTHYYKLLNHSTIISEAAKYCIAEDTFRTNLNKLLNKSFLKLKDSKRKMNKIQKRPDKRILGKESNATGSGEASSKRKENKRKTLESAAQESTTSNGGGSD